MARFMPVGCQAPVRRRAGWYQLHRVDLSEPEPAGPGRKDHPGRQGPRHVLRPGRLPHEPECPEPRYFARRDGSSGQVSAIDNPGLRLCRQFHPSDARSADGRHQQDVPRWVRPRIMDSEPWANSRHALRVSQSPDAPETAGFNNPKGDFGWIHSYETGSTLDGPGIRVVVFMSGCLLRCKYCHNPDTWHLKDGTKISFERAKTALQAYAAPLRAMDGGLTISGGEPLVQMHFTKRLFAAAKGMGLHTALDTSGFLGARADDEYLRQVDLVLLDIKSWDPQTYRHAVGQDVRPTLEFAER